MYICRTKDFVNVLYASQSLVQGCDPKGTEKSEDLGNVTVLKVTYLLCGLFCFALRCVCVLMLPSIFSLTELTIPFSWHLAWSVECICSGLWRTALIVYVGLFSLFLVV